jgi:hypothetical protein
MRLFFVGLSESCCLKNSLHTVEELQQKFLSAVISVSEEILVAVLPEFPTSAVVGL